MLTNSTGADPAPRHPLLARCGHGFTRFMASSGGRAARVALGLSLVTAGVAIGAPVGYVVGALGLVPIAAGILNLCPVAPLWGGHFRGASYCTRPASPSRRPEGPR